MIRDSADNSIVVVVDRALICCFRLPGTKYVQPLFRGFFESVNFATNCVLLATTSRQK